MHLSPVLHPIHLAAPHADRVRLAGHPNNCSEFDDRSAQYSTTADSIDADIIADDASGLHPDLALNRGVNVIVRQPHAFEARTILGMDEDTSRSPGAGSHRQFTKLIAGLLAAAVVLGIVVSVVQTF